MYRAWICEHYNYDIFIGLGYVNTMIIISGIGLKYVNTIIMISVNGWDM
jgi:hypothetical protein